MTLADILNDAYTKNGVIAAGETYDPALGPYALNEANRLLEEFNIRSVMIYTMNIVSFILTARTLPTYWYTIGPTGEFVTPRPLWIERANLVLTSSNPPSRIQLLQNNDLQWMDVTVPSLGSAPYPTEYYMNGDFPNARLYIWPYPTNTGNAIELLVPNQVAAWVAVTDTFAFPPGFQNAYMLTLSEWLCEGLKEIPPTLALAAAKARAYYASLNTASPKMSTTDSGMPNNRSNSGNFHDGWPSN